jgi:hypothetical protein
MHHCCSMRAQLCPSASCSTFHRRDKLKVIMQMKRAAAGYRKFHMHIGAAVFAAPSNWCARSILSYLYHRHMHAGCLHFHHCRVNIKFRAARFVMKLFYDSSQKRWAKWKASKMQCYAATEASLVRILFASRR